LNSSPEGGIPYLVGEKKKGKNPSFFANQESCPPKRKTRGGGTVSIFYPLEKRKRGIVAQPRPACREKKKANPKKKKIVLPNTEPGERGPRNPFSERSCRGRAPSGLLDQKKKKRSPSFVLIGGKGKKGGRPGAWGRGRRLASPVE